MAGTEDAAAKAVVDLATDDKAVVAAVNVVRLTGLVGRVATGGMTGAGVAGSGEIVADVMMSAADGLPLSNSTGLSLA